MWLTPPPLAHSGYATADGGGGGADFCKKHCTPQLALIFSRGVQGHAPPWKNLQSKASNDAFKTIFRAKHVSFFVFETLNGGGGAPAAPLPPGSATGGGGG